MKQKNVINKFPRIRKYFRKKYNLSDDGLNNYIMTKYHLEHIPNREELINLEKIIMYKK